MSNMGLTSKENVLELLLSLIKKDSSADATLEGISQEGNILSYGLICASPFDRNEELPQMIIFGSYDRKYIKTLVVDNESNIKPFLASCLNDLDITLLKVS